MPKKYFRKKHGRGFRYEDEKGNTIKDDNLKEWFRSLVIPPAWTVVEISAKKSADLLVTGRDVKGRKQYIYHPDYVHQQEQVKFERLLAFGEKLEMMREKVSADLRKRKLGREKVLAAMVRLMDEVYLRPGHDRYTQENESYGLTTLRSRHVEISGNEIIFTYKGKSGQEQEHHIRDKLLARIIRELDELPGYRIFKYFNEDGERQEVNSDDLNAYIRSIMGEDFSCKDFRTWAGTLLAATALDEMGCPDDTDVRVSDKNILAVVTSVAENLGNTPAIARKSYIDPLVLEFYRSGKTLRDYCDQAADLLSSTSRLSREEIFLLCMLKS